MSFRFPHDLVSLKRRQIRVYNQLALRPTVGGAELRRDQLNAAQLAALGVDWAGQ
ncbi:hypothetical protein ACFW9N_41840 [Streptomyces sp. NPDC059496]|uniref:hypothetical protein n=1 Tax=Streptomyces sp. NPDC059496 TaxID=3346851 RepID=UPI00367B8072